MESIANVVQLNPEFQKAGYGIGSYLSRLTADRRIACTSQALWRLLASLLEAFERATLFANRCKNLHTLGSLTLKAIDLDWS
jgi:hypothetical protein